MAKYLIERTDLMNHSLKVYVMAVADDAYDAYTVAMALNLRGMGLHTIRQAND